MAETAVGLFHNQAAADAVVSALLAQGIPSDRIRSIGYGEARMSSAPDPATTMRYTDFEASLYSDLSSMGMDTLGCDAYRGALEHGHVVVTATGTMAQADEAVRIMDEMDALDVDEFMTPEPEPVAVGADSPTSFLTHNDGRNDAGTHDVVPKTMRARVTQEREKKEGAQIFSW